mmetsp:Transcript_22023/g.41059  ORF Transcript_22023/g.41059 Transcript_22023/m.41059 type:complete len:132 (-) Transcript_22023:364-759(-)
MLYRYPYMYIKREIVCHVFFFILYCLNMGKGNLSCCFPVFWDGCLLLSRRYETNKMVMVRTVLQETYKQKKQKSLKCSLSEEFILLQSHFLFESQASAHSRDDNASCNHHLEDVAQAKLCPGLYPIQERVQ